MAAPSPTFREYMIGRLPPWLRGYVGEAFGSVLGLHVDTFAEGATRAVEARFVARTTADGLEFAGRERGIARVVGELVESYRARIVGAWQRLTSSDLGPSDLGTKTGMLRQLRLLGYDGDIIEGYQSWNGFRIVLWTYPAGLVNAPRTYGDGATYGQAGLVYGGFNRDMMIALLSAIYANTPVWAVLVQLDLIVGAKLYGTGLPVNTTYGAGATYGGKIISLPLTIQEDYE